MTTRKKLLAALKQNSGEFVSGEVLSTHYHISRAAVSKHISVLKKSGYDIESSPKKGYALRALSPLLLPDEITDGLATDFLGKNEIFYFDTIDSTNNKAKELASNGVPEGCIVVAEKQKAGRGRKGRSWFSAEGDGICLSLILRPAIPPSEASQITLMTAVALAETLLSHTGIDIKIKWPNDILVNGKKLAGILTEMTMEMDAVDYIVIGLGLNVNTPLESFPSEVKTIATSLFNETGRSYSRVGIIKTFLHNFETLYISVQERGFSSIIKRWKELSNIIGKNVTVDVIGKQIKGVVKDIGDDGVLIVMGQDGHHHQIISGDVIVNP